jgi:hypothetical protein
MQEPECRRQEAEGSRNRKRNPECKADALVREQAPQPVQPGASPAAPLSLASEPCAPTLALNVLNVEKRVPKSRLVRLDQ